jgi:hypothetical protein
MLIAVLSVKLKSKPIYKFIECPRVLGADRSRVKPEANQRAATARSLKKNLPSPSNANSIYLSAIS